VRHSGYIVAQTRRSCSCAVENGVYLAASGYDYPSEVVNPLGTVLASVTIGGDVRAVFLDAFLYLVK